MVVSLSSGMLPISGDDVVLDVVGVVGFRVGPDAGLSVDLVPRPHPRCHCVSPSFGYVQPLTFTDRGFEFLLDLGLRLAQHVLDDPFSALRVIACGVTAFPAAIFAFPNVALSVCSSLWHKISPFRQRTIP